jgi:hypothetical protein
VRLGDGRLKGFDCGRDEEKRDEEEGAVVIIVGRWSQARTSNLWLCLGLEEQIEENRECRQSESTLEMGGSLYADLRETVKSFGWIRKALNVMSDEFRELPTFRQIVDRSLNTVHSLAPSDV